MHLVISRLVSWACYLLSMVSHRLFQLLRHVFRCHILVTLFYFMLTFILSVMYSDMVIC